MHHPAIAIPRLTVLLLIGALLSSALLVVGRPAQAAATDLYSALNASRQASRLVPLVRDSRLDSVAQTWTNQMARSQSLAHNPSMSSQIPGGWTRAGENVGYAGTDARLHQAWMDSPGHRANILGSYTSVGIGWAKDSKGRVWSTQVFATYPGTRPPAPAPTTNRFLLAATTPGPATTAFGYGRGSDTPIVGDWNGDGVDTVGVRRGNVVHLRNSNSAGPGELSYSYGRSTDEIVVGDWNGDGADTIGVRRGNTFLLLDGHGTRPVKAFAFGRATDRVVVGDFDGDGSDEIGLRRGSTFFLTDRLAGPATASFSFGRSTDAPLAGDWDGNGRDEVAVRRSNTYFLRQGAGATTTTVSYGTASDRNVVGDFDRDGSDSLGVRR